MFANITTWVRGVVATGIAAADSLWTKFSTWRRRTEMDKEVKWPEPRDDPPEERSEPWAREPRDGDKLPEWIQSLSEHSSPE